MLDYQSVSHVSHPTPERTTCTGAGTGRAGASTSNLWGSIMFMVSYGYQKKLPKKNITKSNGPLGIVLPRFLISYFTKNFRYLKWRKYGPLVKFDVYRGLYILPRFLGIMIGYFTKNFRYLKMEGFRSNLIKTADFGGGFSLPYISRIHTAYIGEDSSILGTWNGWWKNLFFFENVPKW